ncbi:MAG: M56 family metallopeptidase [Gemmatimonadota bacterium]
MIAAWMLRMLVATTLIALGARAAEEAARALGRPRRWVWAAALGLALALPWLGGVIATPALLAGLIEGMLPGGATPAAPGDEVALLIEVPAGGEASTSRPAGTMDVLEAVLIGGWALASLAVALLFARAARRFRTVRRHARADDRGERLAAPADDPGGPGSGAADIVRADTLGPATVGILRPTIVLPRWVDELPADERALIVEHEREHAAARDPALLAAAAIPLLAAPWCLPLWWMHRRLRDATEADCDARVLARGVDRRRYGSALLRTAGRPSAAPITAPALAGANAKRLTRRIVMMTESTPRNPWMRAVPLAALAAAAAFVGCDAAGEVASSADEPEPAAMSEFRVSEVPAEPYFRVREIPAPAEFRFTEVAADSSEWEFEYRATAERRAAAERATGVYRAARDGRLPFRENRPPETEGRIVARGGATFAATDSGAVVLAPGREEPVEWVRRQDDDDAAADAAAMERRDVEARFRETRHGAFTADEPALDFGGDSPPIVFIDGRRIGPYRGPDALDIETSEIQRVEILKGAAAETHLDGETAAGVILITTK